MYKLWNTTPEDVEKDLEDQGLDGSEREKAASKILDELKRKRERAMEELDILGSGLMEEIDAAKTDRQPVEQRWAQDMRQYLGVYDGEDVNTAVAEDAKTRVNVTRNRTNKQAARAYDLLFPADDENYDLTTKETLGDQGEDTTETIARCKRMGNVIKQQLREAGYHAKSRDMIDYAAMLGTGILKGPTIKSKARGSWVRQTDSQGNPIYIEQMVEDKQPGLEFVNPLNCYPGKGTLQAEDMEEVFERHPMTKRQLRKLAKSPGFIKHQMRRVIGKQPDHVPDEATRLIQEISDTNKPGQHKALYDVWECHRELNKEDLVSAGVDIDVDDDELVGYYGEIWVCQGVVIKVKITHMEGETSPPYQFFCWEKDPSSPWGFGVPYLSRHSAKVINSTWRMLLDNAGLSTGPQVVIDKKLIRPADGKWEISPRKIWWLESEIPSQSTAVQNAFNAFDIPFNQEQLSTLQQMAFNFVDMETNTPDIHAQGATSETPQGTASGTAMLLNQQNIDMKRIAKNWDDDVTLPLIGRFYRWNMLYSQRDDIQDDYEVVPRGVSHLAVKDLQAQNYMVLMQAIDHQVYGRYIKAEPTLKNWVSLMGLPGKEVLHTEEEVQAKIEAEQQQMSGQDQAAMMTAQAKQRQVELQAETLAHEREKLQAELSMKNEDIQIRRFESTMHAQRMEMEWQMQMGEQAMKQDMTVENLRTKLGIAEITAEAMIRAAEVKANSSLETAAYKAQAEMIKEASGA